MKFTAFNFWNFVVTLLLGIFSTTGVMAESHIKLKYTGNNKNVLEAVKKANEILNSKAFYNEIRNSSQFDNTRLSSAEIADRIEKASQTIDIIIKTKPIANASTKSSNRIDISRTLFGKKNRVFDLAVAVNTLIHETVHAVDYLNTGNEFTHNGNYAAGQEKTAPWVIGGIAEKMVEQKNN